MRILVPIAHRRAVVGPAVLIFVAIGLLSQACEKQEASEPLRITFIGDSLTYGVDGHALQENPTRFSSVAPPVDRLGGFPGRLQRRLGDRARVLSRGIYGSTTVMWLDDLQGPAQISDHIVDMDLPYPDLFRFVGWIDFDANDEKMLSAPSVLLAALGADRPDVVILLIGVNDFVPALVQQGPDIVASTAERIRRLRRQAESVTKVVLVSTLLPNERDSKRKLDRLNAQIRSDHPDFLPLGEEFAARNWRALLSDGIHPNEAGYELLAKVLEDLLVSRTLIPSGDSIR